MGRKVLSRSYDRVVKNSESHLEPNVQSETFYSVSICNPAYIILSRYGLRAHTH